jgi:hypothetical protein
MAFAAFEFWQFTVVRSRILSNGGNETPVKLCMDFEGIIALEMVW